MSTHTFFSLCVPSPVATLKVPFSQPCFDHFFGPCFRGHDEAGLLPFEALQGLPRFARGTKTKRGSRGLESTKYYGWGPLAMIDGVAVGDSGAFWTCKSIVCQSCASFGKKGHCRISFSELSKIGLGLQEVVLPSCVEELLPNFDPLASCEDLCVKVW